MLIELTSQTLRIFQDYQSYLWMGLLWLLQPSAVALRSFPMGKTMLAVMDYTHVRDLLFGQPRAPSCLSGILRPYPLEYMTLG